MEKIQQTIDYLNLKTNSFKPEIAIILGTGLDYFCDNLSGISIKYSEIPNFCETKVQGHKGELLFCEVENKKAVIMRGRIHYYEGYSIEECVYPIKVFKKLGVNTLFITSISGAAHKWFEIGDVMMILDHINFLGVNPMRASCNEFNDDASFDMSCCYSKALQNLAIQSACELNISLKEGVYFAVSGPCYETPAEVRAFRTLGADVIGMSLVPEVVVANSLHMNIAGFSLISNYAAGVVNTKINTKDILKISTISGFKLCSLIRKMISKL